MKIKQPGDKKCTFIETDKEKTNFIVDYVTSFDETLLASLTLFGSNNIYCKQNRNNAIFRWTNNYAFSSNSNEKNFQNEFVNNYNYLGFGIAIGKNTKIKYLILKAEYKRAFETNEFDNTTQIILRMTNKQ